MSLLWMCSGYGRMHYKERLRLLFAETSEMSSRPSPTSPDFQVPNPTFFQGADTWPMFDNADPLNGWSAEEVEDRPSGLATADIYGKLYYHLRTVLRAFILRLSSLQVAFRLMQVDADDLGDYVESSSFDRIEHCMLTAPWNIEGILSVVQPHWEIQLAAGQ
ncbi:hypothetical protein VTK26DRAFT_505 [Humicola hyalothermophila]